MLATIELFDHPTLAGDPARLRSMFHGRSEAIARVPGLHSKVWFNSTVLGQFGAFLLWESPEALDAFRATEDAESITARWGVRPSVRDFDVYQTVAGGVVKHIG